uniref:Predicted protein n=1 Tax=Hordeum vulgare subsp. vulgare TaxID=112509 RepID=F2D160_HORVV|nr:predicted protein [Hordeum vulgare subsp. vulgare]
MEGVPFSLKLAICQPRWRHCPVHTPAPAPARLRSTTCLCSSLVHRDADAMEDAAPPLIRSESTGDGDEDEGRGGGGQGYVHGWYGAGTGCKG